ncbi:MAG: hypothetical protein ABJ275_06515 [Maricaulaceae bacterium]
MKGRITAETKLKNTMDKQTFLSRLEEQGVVFPFPWMVVSTRELSELLSIPLQTIHNWEIRGKGPVPVTHGVWRGNRRYRRIADVIAWLDDVPVWTVYRDWLLEKYINLSLSTPKQCEEFINDLIAKRVYVQPRWKLKRYNVLPFVTLGRE